MTTTTTAPAETATLALRDVTYRYPGTDRDVLRGISASFTSGAVHTIVGKSGSGKSTLLSLIAGLDTAGSGEVAFNGTSLAAADRDRYRARDIGVVFQGFNLVTNASAVQNIVLSMNISGSPVKDKAEHAYALLERLGISREDATRPVLKLSGGQQQRVGIARALSHDPAVIIADEPTGALDEKTEEAILGIFTHLAHVENRCVIIVTHSKRVTQIADVVLGIKSGKIGVVGGHR
ncbi:ABC transporter ATP-binding protein [Nocardiopsis aegyptia]|uniref:Putative ABC transport system ATP-binding protein n=1 Tax=Nocardiopsis aegyptia TaxID=220378 RepID=A0A7Z0J9S1_9ACTN|nr:ABC transporter ATP-binding protein [Nocardiopsis aegyptia]NYJ34366.1 putative ABC transport system ATP-binding protein [Nocardiopsis aegyptia]